MKLKILSTATETQDALASLSQWAEYVDLAYAWASSSAGTAKHWRALDLRKVRHAVIGTQFAQTEPWVLRKLDEVPGRLKIVISSEGTFHPKMAIGRKGKKVRVIMGSSNLTAAGFSSNIELNALIDGDVSDPEVAKLLAFQQRAWDGGEKLEANWLAQYDLAWARRPRGAGLVPQAALQLQSFDSIDLDWSRYVSLILSQENRRAGPTYRVSLFGDSKSYLAEFTGEIREQPYG